jgi:GntR family transcriptional regulator
MTSGLKAAQATGKPPLPLYHTIYMVLHEQILDGRYPTDQTMPSEHELAGLFKVSRITVRRALEKLAEDGMISRHRGRGTFPTPQRTARPLQTFTRGLYGDLLAVGVGTTPMLLAFAYITAPDDVAASLELPPGAIVQRAIRVRFYNDTPMSHLVTYVPEDIGRTYEEAELKTKPLLGLIERSGSRISTAQQAITARLADATVASALKVEIGSPVLAIMRVVRDQTGRAVEYIRASYRPDLYEFNLTMSQVSAGTKTK